MVDKNLTEVRIHQSWQVWLIRILGVGGTLAVLIVMALQLISIRDEQTMTLRPYVNLDQDMVLRDGGKENEVWDLSYVLLNSGRFPAKQVFYRIEHTASSEFGTPNVFDNKGPIMIPPYGAVFSTTKTLPRSEVLRIQGQGDVVYRHLYVKYESDRGNSYYSRSSWILSGYEVGSPISWVLAQSDGN